MAHRACSVTHADTAHLHLLLCNHLFRIPLANPALSIYMPHKPSHSFFSGLDLINILPEYQRLFRSSLEHPLRWLHRNQRREQDGVLFHPLCVETSGHTVRSIACRWDIIPRPPVCRLRRVATLRRRSVASRAASRCRPLQSRQDASRETKVGESGNSTPGASFSARRAASEYVLRSATCSSSPSLSTP